MKLALATRNPGKVTELQALLADADIDVVSLDALGVPAEFDVEEIGETFPAIAEKKAREYGQKTHLLTVADDSGLCVAALDGQPGVHSKRFISGTDQERNQAILKMMAGKTDRAAYFISVLALFDPTDDTVHFFEGRVDGQIAPEERGTAGFGYDPLFIPDGYTQTFGELGKEVKNQVSHRARALQKLKTYLEQLAKPSQNS
jgi:XTP/dITP diphosphohydrolase